VTSIVKLFGLYPLTCPNSALLTLPSDTANGAVTLCALPSGELTAETVDQSTHAARVADLLLRDSTSGPLCYLVPRDQALFLDGVKPLPLAALTPGSLLSLGPRRWLVTMRCQPKPAPASAELAERKCPVCGGELKLAPIVQCPCGRYYHLEKPDAGAGEDVLNCYLASACGLCNRPPSLAPVLVPEPPEKLLDVVSA